MSSIAFFSGPSSPVTHIAFFALALSAAACERPDPAEQPTEETSSVLAGDVTVDPAMARTAECADSANGYAVAYPATWHTNTGEILSPCSLFDPDPIEVPRDSEIPIEFAIAIGFQPIPCATLTGDMLGRRVLSRQPTRVDGRGAMRIESESTGEGLYDAGIRSYQYFVDLGDTTLIATTYGSGSLPLERKRRILDAMMATLDFRQPGSPEDLDQDRNNPR